MLIAMTDRTTVRQSPLHFQKLQLRILGGATECVLSGGCDGCKCVEPFKNKFLKEVDTSDSTFRQARATHNGYTVY